MLLMLAISGDAAVLRGRFDLPSPTVITAVAVDSQGFIYQTGVTRSTGFPVTPGPLSKFSGNADAFVRKLSPDAATVIYSVLVGGSVGAQATAIAVDGQGNTFVTGSTTSPDFPVTPPFAPTHLPSQNDTDVFVFKLNAAGTALVFARLFGGDGADAGASLALATDGTITVGGSTASNGIPVTSTALQSAPAVVDDSAFVIRLAADGSLDYGTYLGGNGGATATGVAVDLGGDIYVAGYAGEFFPTTAGSLAPQASSGGFFGGFVSRINGQTGQFVYSTYLPGVFGGIDFVAPGLLLPAVQVRVDSSSNVYLSGVAGAGFPATAGAFQRDPSAEGNGFVLELDNSGAGLVFATLIGGTGGDVVYSIALTGDSITVAGNTISLDFPTSDHSLPSCNLGSGQDLSQAFLASFDHSGKLITSVVYGGCQGETGTSLAAGSSGVVLALASYETNGAFLALIDMTASLPVQIAAAVSAASFDLGPLAPLEIVSVFGSGLGPKKGVSASLPASLPLSLSGTQVFVNGLPAPLLFVQENQITLIVPAAQSPGELDEISVTSSSGGSASSSQNLFTYVAQYVPTLFTADGSGIGAGAILNQDGSPNAASNPAARGSVVTLFGTGGGLTTPLFGDGQMAAGPATLAAASELGVIVEDQFCDIAYVGAAPGMVNGVTQVNVVLPQGAPTGIGVPITIFMGNLIQGFVFSQPAVTIAIQ